MSPATRPIPRPRRLSRRVALLTALAALAALTSTPAPAASEVVRPRLATQAPSAMLLVDPMHTGQSAHPAPVHPRIAWTQRLPVVDPTNDQRLGFQTPVGAILATPAQDLDGTIYVAAGARLTAVSPDGDVLWSQALRGDVVGSPALDGRGGVYVATVDGRLFCLSTHDGAIHWIQRLPAEIRASPVLHGDRLYVSAFNQTIAMTRDGTELWRFIAPDSSFNSTPAVGPDGTLYVGNWSGVLYALRPDGQRRWSLVFPPEGLRVTSPCVTPEGQVFIVRGNTDAMSNPALLHGVETIVTEHGHALHREFLTAPLLAPSFAFPSVARSGAVLTADVNGTIYGVRPDGSEAFTTHIAGQSFLNPIVSDRDGRMLAVSVDGALVILSADGRLEHITALPEGNRATPLIGRPEDGRARLYVALGADLLIALEAPLTPAQRQP